MAQQLIQIGATANDGTGDPLRLAFEKINNNFTELYSFSVQGAAAPDGAVQFRATNSLSTVAYNSSVWVVFGEPYRYFYSTDGVSWSNQNSPSDENINSVVSTPLGFIAVGNNGTILTSQDMATTWDTQTSGTTEDLLRVYYTSSNGLYLAVGKNGKILTSADAITWTTRASGVTEDLRGIARNSATGVYCVVGDSGRILVSSNGTSWTTQTSGVSVDLTDIVFDGGSYVATGNNGTIIVSTNGVTWLQSTSGTTENITGISVGVVASTVTLVAVGNNGVELTSNDGAGTTWTPHNVGTTSNLLGTTYDGNNYYVVGLDGSIFSSATSTSWANVSVVASFDGSANFVFDVNTSTLNVTNIDSSNIVANISNSNISVANQVVVYEYANLGDVGNIYIGGGSANYVLSTDGSGNLSWTEQTGGGGNGVPGGSNTQLQYNNNGVFGGISGFTYDNISANLNVTSANLNIDNINVLNISSGMPYYIGNSEVYLVPDNQQGLFALPITIDGEFIVMGLLYQV